MQEHYPMDRHAGSRASNNMPDSGPLCSNLESASAHPYLDTLSLARGLSPDHTQAAATTGRWLLRLCCATAYDFLRSRRAGQAVLGATTSAHQSETSRAAAAAGAASAAATSSSWPRRPRTWRCKSTSALLCHPAVMARMFMRGLPILSK